MTWFFPIWDQSGRLIFDVTHRFLPRISTGFEACLQKLEGLSMLKPLSLTAEYTNGQS